MSDYPDAMLMVERGIDEASVIPLDGNVCVIGKSSSADGFADNPYVSRQHAQISVNVNRFKLRDLGSKSGTFLNGIRIEPDQATALPGGDLIELARG
ncbi:MAG: FHA domain-containing protein [SAR202 cluster bacterium]|nr:FHA domain-containing protein [SAR202 cluster bacterium]MDP6300069.1 FHA domain-containing protein [SAR202 cluster bacterium]MDP7103524.1 FHA domain-containing protein [SAR202 cluster bacterium]MDP7225710.1 FHA domain-containing protein [SAR202 cluster bacterium]